MARPEWGSDVLATFVELAALPSPPGEERAVADRVLDYLAALGLEADEDDAGAKVGSTMGNVYCRLEPTGGAGESLFFCAHLDTVLPEAAIEPVVGEDPAAERHVTSKSRDHSRPFDRRNDVPRISRRSRAA